MLINLILTKDKTEYSIALCVIILCFAGYLCIPNSFWIDWDSLMYMVDVKVWSHGDGSFSFAHNLLKSWMFDFYKFIRFFNDDISLLQSNQILTWIFSSISGICIFSSIKYLTNDSKWSFAGALFWFIVPGNTHLILSLEDNVWASAFLSFFLLSSIRACKISHIPTDNAGTVSWVWVLLASTSLSIGINIHQQLCLLFYLFMALIIVAPKIKLENKIISIIIFIFTYITLSVVQNYIAFGQLELYNSVTRLYSNPYSKYFPNLWFFSSTKTLGEWINLVLLGWKRTLLFNETQSPIFYYYFAILFYSYLLLSHAQRKQKKFTERYIIAKNLLWLMPTFVIFIPYSLLYEPENIERWDSVLPGATICIFSFGFIANKYLATNLSWKKITFLSVDTSEIIFLCILIINIVQSFNHISKMKSGYNTDFSINSINTILQFLNQNKEYEKYVLILDERIHKSDMDSLITIHFPKCSFVVVDKDTLLPVFSNEAYNSLKTDPEKPIYSVDFKDSNIIGIMPEIYKIIKSIQPSFLDRHTLCDNDSFLCNAEYYFLNSEKLESLWLPQKMRNSLNPIKDIQVKEADDAYDVVSTGNDPSILLKDIITSANNNVIIRINMHSSMNTISKIYYKTKEKQGFTENNVIRESVNKGPNDLFFKLPMNILKGDIRFDPSELQGEYKIYSIEVRGFSSD